jgi:AraC family transcriptional activator of pobA
MQQIKTFSLSTHGKLFSVSDNDNREYLFVEGAVSPYQEEPYRAESYAIVYIKEGGVRMNTGLGTWNITAPSIITIGPSVIRYFTKTSEYLRMDVIFFKDAFLLERHTDLFFLTKYDFFENSDLHVLPRDVANIIKFSKIFELIQLTQATANFHQAELIRNYIFALIFEIDAHHRLKTAETPNRLKENILLTKFRTLLKSKYMHEHKLDFYADHLNLTPKSLSAAIKKQTGRPAGKWINEVITLEAKVLLQNKTLTVSQVSEMLNFSDQSVFGKFFRAATGVSPVEYRKKIN